MALHGLPDGGAAHVAMKVSLPGIKGTISVGYIFVLFSITRFSSPRQRSSLSPPVWRNAYGDLNSGLRLSRLRLPPPQLRVQFI